MITVLVKDCNQFSQSYYYSVVERLQLHQIKCSCGRSACLHPHAYYYRSVRTPSGCFRLRVLRLKCSECGRTHAVLPSSVVPYDQFSLESQLLVVCAFENGSNPTEACETDEHLDENSVKAILRRYRKHWREKLTAERIRLHPITDLILQCFAFYSAQLLQIRRMVNTLFVNTT